MIENKKVKSRIKELIDNADELVVLGFLSKYFGYIPFRGDDCRADLYRKMTNADTDKERNLDFLDAMENEAWDVELRVCSTCGEFITEGYYLAGDYACSDECAIKNYMKDSDNPSYEEAKKQFEADLQADEDECYGEVYWTEWED